MAIAPSQAITPEAVDPLSALLAQLGKLPVTTTNSANTGPLQQIIAQLQEQGTPAGSAALINQIYTLGMNQQMPGIVNSLNVTGSRAGTSSYQALATNDLTSRLAGQAAVALQDNTKSAATAAANLANATKSTTVTSGAKNILQAALYPMLASGVAKGLKPTFDNAQNDITNYLGDGINNLLNPAAGAAADEASSDAANTAIGAGSDSFVTGLMTPDSVAPADFSNSLTGTPDTSGAMASPSDMSAGMNMNFASDYASSVAADGDTLTADQATQLYQNQQDLGIVPSDSSNSGGNLLTDIGISSLQKGRLTDSTVADGGVNAAIGAIPVVGPAMMVAQMFGNPGVTDALAPLYSSADELTSGMGDALGGLISDTLGAGQGILNSIGL